MLRFNTSNAKTRLKAMMRTENNFKTDAVEL